MKTPPTTNFVGILIVSLIILTIVLIISISFPSGVNNDTHRYPWVVTALAAASMSMSLSGSINIGNQGQVETFAQKSPNVWAAGALVVFVPVYLFNPINVI